MAPPSHNIPWRFKLLVSPDPVIAENTLKVVKEMARGGISGQRLGLATGDGVERGMGALQEMHETANLQAFVEAATPDRSGSVSERGLAHLGFGRGPKPTRFGRPEFD